MENMTAIISDQTERSLWTIANTICCIPARRWNSSYCGMPLWKHVYHTLHSLDRWYINPSHYEEPVFHTPDLNNLDAPSEGCLSKEQMLDYLASIRTKLSSYIADLTPESLNETPPQCPYTRFQLILAQHRHLDMHTGMLMGFLIAAGDGWPKVMGIDTNLNDPPKGDFL